MCGVLWLPRKISIESIKKQADWIYLIVEFLIRLLAMADPVRPARSREWVGEP
jgi:hypothetical protein